MKVNSKRKLEVKYSFLKPIENQDGKLRYNTAFSEVTLSWVARIFPFLVTMIIRNYTINLSQVDIFSKMMSK